MPHWPNLTIGRVPVLEALIIGFVVIFVVATICGTVYLVHTRFEVERTKRVLDNNAVQRLGMQNAFEIKQEELSLMREKQQGELGTGRKEVWQLNSQNGFNPSTDPHTK